MLHSIFNSLFGCAHERTTFPITPARKAVAAGVPRSGAYVACLECGKEFAYDWKQMRVGEPMVPPASVAKPQPILAPPETRTLSWVAITMDLFAGYLRRP